MRSRIYKVSEVTPPAAPIAVRQGAASRAARSRLGLPAGDLRHLALDFEFSKVTLASAQPMPVKPLALELNISKDKVFKEAMWKV